MVEQMKERLLFNYAKCRADIEAMAEEEPL